MFNHVFGRRYVALILAGAALSACVSITSVKDVTADKIGYLSKRFTPESLSPAIRAKVPDDSAPAKFSRMVITNASSEEKSDGQKESWTNVVTYVDAGHGLIERMTESSSNDIPYRLHYSLTYKGLINLKWQQVPLRGENADMLYELKEIRRFDAIPSAIDKDFEMDFSSGWEPQLANYSSVQDKCKTTGEIQASEIHKKFSGKALQISCETYSNNAVLSRAKWVLLEDYGIALTQETTTPSKKVTVRVTDVNS